MSWVGGQRPPLNRFDAAGEDIRIEGRMARHRQYIAGVGVECDQCAGAIADGFLSHPLQVEIDGHYDAVTGRLRDLAQQPQPPADRVDFDFLTAAIAAQSVFPASLEAEFTDFIPHSIVGQTSQILYRDLAYISQQMCPEPPVDIVTLGVDLQTDSR